LFLLTFAGFVILLVMICRTDLAEYLIPALAGIGVLLVILGARSVYHAWPLRRQQLPRAPLSRDELRKARSKLVKDPKSS
jgi:hypothetical protein